jgi:hypothetical protein
VGPILGSSRRVLAIAGAAVAGALVVFLVLLFSGGDDDSGGLSPIAQAAERTARTPGARMEFTATMSGPGIADPVEIEGSGVYNGVNQRSRMVMHMSNAPSLGEVTFTTVGEGLVIYQRSDVFESELPEGKHWLKMDLSELAGDPTTATGAGLDEQLRQLEAVSDDVRKVGAEQVRGAPTDHYAATIDLERQVEQARDDGLDEAADLMEASIEDTGVSESPVEVWIDEDGLLRRMSMELALPTPAGTATMKTTEEIYDFGIKPAIDLPPEEQVIDAAELIQDSIWG